MFTKSRSHMPSSAGCSFKSQRRFSRFSRFRIGRCVSSVLAIILGFPIALIIAWAFELTPQGLKRTEDVDRPTQAHRKSHAWIYIVLVAAAFSVGLFFVGRYTGQHTSGATPNELPAKSIAVLPLLNESGNPKDEYFSDGLSEELIAALSHIGQLKVIGRSSSFRFKEHQEDSKTIGEKLGVATLLEGTVRKQGNRVRIVAELINARMGSQFGRKPSTANSKTSLRCRRKLPQRWPRH